MNKETRKFIWGLIIMAIAYMGAGNTYAFIHADREWGIGLYIFIIIMGIVNLILFLIGYKYVTESISNKTP